MKNSQIAYDVIPVNILDYRAVQDDLLEIRADRRIVGNLAVIIGSVVLLSLGLSGQSISDRECIGKDNLYRKIQSTSLNNILPTENIFRKYSGIASLIGFASTVISGIYLVAPNIDEMKEDN
ncbi:hypothetical protein KW787_04030 [Candidatus Pacearchaeota archaeon]|nr:hypothetical protein [Candidatus Pacearchaeota archaeon]